MAKQHDFSHLNTPQARAWLEEWGGQYRAEHPSPLWDADFSGARAQGGLVMKSWDRAFATVHNPQNGTSAPTDLLASAPPVRGAEAWAQTLAVVQNPFKGSRGR
jgi:hypothetical protein